MCGTVVIEEILPHKYVLNYLEGCVWGDKINLAATSSSAGFFPRGKLGKRDVLVGVTRTRTRETARRPHIATRGPGLTSHSQASPPLITRDRPHVADSARAVIRLKRFHPMISQTHLSYTTKHLTNHHDPTTKSAIAPPNTFFILAHVRGAPWGR